MATETEMTAAREPGPGQVPVLVTRFGGQQRIFPVGARVRVGRDPAFELVSVNPLVSRQCHGLITSDQRGATYVDQSRRVAPNQRLGVRPMRIDFGPARGQIR